MNMIATVTLDDFVEEIPHSQVFSIILIDSDQNYLKYDFLFFKIEYFDAAAILLFFFATNQINQGKFQFIVRVTLLGRPVCVKDAPIYQSCIF